MTLKSFMFATLMGGSLSLMGCEDGNTRAESSAETDIEAAQQLVYDGPSMLPNQEGVTGPDSAPAQKITAQPTSNSKSLSLIKGQAEPLLPVGPDGLMRFISMGPTGALSRTTVISRRIAPSGTAIATLQIDRKDTATLMDIAFDCPKAAYVYLFMDHKARPVDAAKIKRVQAFSDRQLSAFDRGEALQSLKFIGLETFPPEDIADYKRVMQAACEP